MKNRNARLLSKQFSKVVITLVVIIVALFSSRVVYTATPSDTDGYGKDDSGKTDVYFKTYGTATKHQMQVQEIDCNTGNVDWTGDLYNMERWYDSGWSEGRYLIDKAVPGECFRFYSWITSGDYLSQSSFTQQARRDIYKVVGYLDVDKLYREDVIPSIEGLNPASATSGTGSFTLVVNGSGFSFTSKVRWNGEDRSTTFVSRNQLQATITADDIAVPDVANVTVYNPGGDGGVSSGLTFTLNPSGPSIMGQVTDGNGHAIADVPILCQGLYNNQTVSTNSNGNYFCGGLVTGLYQVKSPPGSLYTLSPSVRIVMVGSSGTTGQDFTTTPLYGILGGKVTNKQTGQAIANARVSVAGYVVRTDGNGNYSINNVLPGSHTIRVSAEDYKDYKGYVTVRANQSSSRNVKLEPQRSEGYYLPYPGGETYKCTQGNNGSYSHQTRWDRYAFDFGTRYDPIVASRAGRVVKTDVGRCHGNYIKIRHSDRTETLYAHLSRISVRENQKVEPGQVIGRSGNTGCVTGPHIHFVRRYAGTYTAVRTRFLDASTASVGGIPQAGNYYKSDNYRTFAQMLEDRAPVSDTGVIWGDVQLYVTSAHTFSLKLWAASYLTDVTAVRLATTSDELVEQSWLPYSETTHTTQPWDMPIVFAQYKDADGLESDIVSDTIEAVAYEPLHAAFAVSPTVCVGADVPIVNQTFPLCEQCNWHWDFGDNSTSHEMEPYLGDPETYRAGYHTEGLYTIVLTATNMVSTSVFSAQTQALPSPSAAFDIERSGNTITVQAADTNAQDWFWDFGDGGTATGSSIASHTYTDTNFLDNELVVVGLVVEGRNGCSNSDYRYVPTKYEVYLPLIVK